MRALLPVLFAIACSPTGVTIVSDGDTSDTTGLSETTPSDTDPSDTSDTTGDTQEEEEEEVNPFEALAGDYEGDLWLILESEWFDYELEDCTVEAVVSEEGAVEGEGSCELRGGGGWGANAWGGNGGWGGGDEEVPLFFEGELDEEGELSGVIEFDVDFSYIELEPMEMVGEVVDDEMVFDFDGEIVTDWVTATVFGEGELGR